MMEVARALSSQNPALSESCLSFSILSRRLSTSKKPPYPGNAGPHIIQFFDCHSGRKGKHPCGADKVHYKRYNIESAEAISSMK